MDINFDCLSTPTDPPLPNLIIEADGLYDFYAKTDSAGNYKIVCDTGQYIIKPKLWNNLYDLCQPPISVSLTDTAQIVDSLDFSAQTLLECPFFEVSISTPLLRRCFENNYYASYCNYGTAPHPDARMQVVLPQQLDFVASGQPHTVSGDTLFFQLGAVGVGACGSFSFKVLVDCDSTAIGQTLCVAATVLPDTACLPENPAWSGAHVEVSIDCPGDTAAHFTIRNTGNAPTAPALEYIVVEDQIVLRYGDFNLAPGEAMTLVEPAEGQTWRIEAQQEPFHPGFSMPTAVLEGCGGLVSTGLVNQFPPDDADGFTDVDCRAVVGSWDPNDKQAVPEGFGNQHFIEANTDLEYFIRFQNTGTDTAFTVVVADTLSPLLDPTSLRPGAASHPYEWDLSGQGILRFSFKNILLPDSNANEAASHGFIRFRIAQRLDLPLGSVIENRAGIFFDFNPAVLTNTTFHTVGKDFVPVAPPSATNEPFETTSVFPNPARAGSWIFFEKNDCNGLTFRLFDALGREVSLQKIRDGRARLPEKTSPGMFTFRLEKAGEIAGAGRVAVFGR